MRRRTGPILAAIALLTLAAPPARAGLDIQADNDYFDFWIPRNLRPDRDYTQGLRISMVRDAPPRWFPPFARRGTPCGGASPGEPCVLASFELGQELFTPTYNTVESIPGQRPYAARLYVGAGIHRIGDRSVRTLLLRVGITGVPALGEAAQIAFHRLLRFSRPLGWDHQVPFEPALEGVLTEERTLAAVGARGERLLDVSSLGRATVGNWLTGAALGLTARAGYGLLEPGRGPRGPGARPFSAYAVGRVREDWVLHDLTLDGSTFGESPEVRKRPLVFQCEVGGGVRAGPVTLEYRAVYRGREYDTGPVSHHWGSIRLFLGRAAPGES
jgi:lipid A 3-O-deacylase